MSRDWFPPEYLDDVFTEAEGNNDTLANLGPSLRSQAVRRVWSRQLSSGQRMSGQRSVAEPAGEDRCGTGSSTGAVFTLIGSGHDAQPHVGSQPAERLRLPTP